MPEILLHSHGQSRGCLSILIQGVTTTFIELLIFFLMILLISYRFYRFFDFLSFFIDLIDFFIDFSPYLFWLFSSIFWHNFVWI